MRGTASPRGLFLFLRLGHHHWRGHQRLRPRSGRWAAFLCAYPSHLQPINLRHAEDDQVFTEAVHVVNCYVHISDAPLRRRMVIKNHHQELEALKKKAEDDEKKRTISGPPAQKKVKIQATNEASKQGWKPRSERRQVQQPAPMTTQDLILDTGWKYPLCLPILVIIFFSKN